jgi:hypothetical protein
VSDAGRSHEATARRRARKEGRRDDFFPPMGRCRPAPPAEPTSPPDFSVRTLDGCSWDFEGRYCRWNLPTHNGRPVCDGPIADDVMEFLAQHVLSARQAALRGGFASTPETVQ